MGQSQINPEWPAVKPFSFESQKVTGNERRLSLYFHMLFSKYYWAIINGMVTFLMNFCARVMLRLSKTALSKILKQQLLLLGLTTHKVQLFFIPLKGRRKSLITKTFHEVTSVYSFY